MCPVHRSSRRHVAIAVWMGLLPILKVQVPLKVTVDGERAAELVELPHWNGDST